MSFFQRLNEANDDKLTYCFVLFCSAMSSESIAMAFSKASWAFYSLSVSVIVLMLRMVFALRPMMAPAITSGTRSWSQSCITKNEATPCAQQSRVLQRSGPATADQRAPRGAVTA